MAIQIRKKLTKEQYLKLFSNPVSGIACQIEPKLVEFENEHSFGVKEEKQNFLKNIRYSKSMIMKALGFWHEQMWEYYKKISRINNPLDPNTSEFKDEHSPSFGRIALKQCDDILQAARLVSKCPDTFLFSHRHIEEVNLNHYRKFGGSGIAETNYLLNEKYKDIGLQTFRPQEGTLDPFVVVKTSIGIEFTVFPCEHPYIPKQKISKVGITDNGNVYILHDREKK